MKFPRRIKIGAVSFDVTDDESEWMEIEHKLQRKGDYGHMDPAEAVIYLNPKQANDVKQLTLWHEILHALMETVVGSPDWNDLGKERDQREESIVRTVESPTLLVLRDNPLLVEYLMFEEYPNG